MKASGVVVACALSWSLVACEDVTPSTTTDKDGGGGGDTDMPNPLDIDKASELLAPLAEAQCAWMFRCCSTDELAADLGPAVGDPEDCSTRLLSRAGRGLSFYSQLSNDFPMALQRLARLAYAPNAPHFSVDEKAIEECAKATKDRDCKVGASDACEPQSPTSPSDDPCDLRKLFVGERAVGDECDASAGDLECEAGARCVTTTYPRGVCLSAVPKMGLCLDSSECAAGLLCDPKKGLCVEGIAEGEKCAFADPTRPVPGTEVAPCAWGLICDTVRLVCADERCAAGTQCLQDAMCPTGLSCIRNHCGMPAKGGEPCSEPADCESNVCAYDPQRGGSFCQVLLTNGVSCDRAQDCASGYCDDETTMACQPKSRPGDPCTSVEQCAGGTCNLGGASPTCVALGVEGDACEDQADCASLEGFECRGKACHKRPFAASVPCDYATDCASGACVERVCVNRGKAGSACGLNKAACEEDLYCDVLEPETGLGECQPKKGFGAQCSGDWECLGQCQPRNGLLRCTGGAQSTFCGGK